MRSSLGYLPIALVLLAFATFTLSYIIAVVRSDVTAFFPYISDTGAEIPESCIFGQFLNIAAFISLCTMYVRYKAVHALTSGEDRSLIRMNRFAMFLGVISSLGCSMVANFQEGTAVEAVHITGAFLVFVVGVFYTFVQTAMSYHMYPDYNGLSICRIRLAICLASLCSIIGFTAHVISTIGEWVTAFTFLSFFFTYVREFQKFQLTIVTRPMVRHLDEEPCVDQEPNEHTRLLI